MLKPKWITKIAATVNPHSSTPGKFYSDSTALRVLRNQLIVVNQVPGLFVTDRCQSKKHRFFVLEDMEMASGNAASGNADGQLGRFDLDVTYLQPWKPQS